jgi:D-glycero-alpha-D-manno-heptose-7-phosphate kinase
MMQKVVARAPTRVDLAGGTLDLWPIHNLIERKMTVNVGISLFAVTEVTQSPSKQFSIQSHDQNLAITGSFREVCEDETLALISKLLEVLWRDDLPALEIVTRAQSPAGAGLGGSSALAISVAAALLRARRLLGSPIETSEEQLISIVQDVESKIIFAPTGCQDYWGAVRGGVNLIEFPYGPARVTTFRSDILDDLTQRVILCYSGKSRASACNNWNIYKKVFDRDREVLQSLSLIGQAAWRCGNALREGELVAALANSREEWELRKNLWPDIETPETISIDSAARAAGADFTRVCGAGGGGVMSIFADPRKRDQVISAVQSVGGSVLSAEIGVSGLAVEHERLDGGEGMACGKGYKLPNGNLSRQING